MPISQSAPQFLMVSDIAEFTSTAVEFNLTGVPRSDRTTIDHASLFGVVGSSAFRAFRFAGV
jgi:hypothetical protein